MLCVIDTESSSAESNMSRDAQLLDSLEEEPILHLYGWERPSATYGHFIDPAGYFDMEAIKRREISLARRSTGGGIVFHIWDYAFSFLMPSSHPYFSTNTLDNYRFVNEIVLEVIKKLFLIDDCIHLIADDFPAKGPSCSHFCMARPTQYDVVYKGVKIAGAAQRRTKKGYLHQGTISLASPDEALLRELLISGNEVVSAMEEYTFAPLGKSPSTDLLAEARSSLRDALKIAFRAGCGV